MCGGLARAFGHRPFGSCVLWDAAVKGLSWPQSLLISPAALAQDRDKYLLTDRS